MHLAVARVIVALMSIVALVSLVNITTPDQDAMKAEVVNGIQVYLTWPDSGYNSHWDVCRSTMRGSYYGVIAQNLTETRYVDTPPASDYPYYYIAIRYDNESGREEYRTKEVRVNLP